MKYKEITITVIDPESLKKDVDMLGIRQREMARDLHISSSMCNRWINGKQYVPNEYIDKVESYIEARKQMVESYLKEEE